MRPEPCPHPRYRLYTTRSNYIPRPSRSSDPTRDFETEISRRFAIAAAVCVSRARDGLHLVLREIIRPGGKVVMSSLTIVDVVNAVIAAGGIPVFGDVRRDTCGLDPDVAESLIDDHTDAVLVTHLHGQSAGARVFREICDRHGVRLIEDAAQAFGAVESGRHLGTFGDAGVYSFGLFKNLTTLKGGMVVSDDRALIERVRRRIDETSMTTRRELVFRTATAFVLDVATHPTVFRRFAFPVLKRHGRWIDRQLDTEGRARRHDGLPSSWLRRMRPIQSVMGLHNLDDVDRHNHARIERAGWYRDGLSGVPEILLPGEPVDGNSIYTTFAIQIPDRQAFLDHARARGRDIGPQYLRNCADLTSFREFYRDCPRARGAAATLTLLPTYPRYPRREIVENVEVLREFVDQNPRSN